jgi:oligopeptide/dipeptide ABC transporter ATP-binding protein
MLAMRNEPFGHEAGTGNSSLSPSRTTEAPVLAVQNLRTYFFTPSGVVKAVDDVSFNVYRDDVLAIVGESGSGKSVTALSTMKLVPIPPGRYVSGQIMIDGVDILSLPDHQLQEVRGARISMIFQNPRAALNPSFTLLRQLTETIRQHDRSISKKEVAARALNLLGEAGISDPAQVAESYPHQVSSGMCQRVGLALSMACDPELLIADEPTTMLDAGVQAKILMMLKREHTERHLPIILITHDFGVVRALAKRIIVMYAGMIQEEGAAEMIITQPQHPYTKALILSVPNPDNPVRRLFQIAGQPPDLSRLPRGCSFAERCDSVMPRCRNDRPGFYRSPTGSFVRCHLFASSSEVKG